MDYWQKLFKIDRASNNRTWAWFGIGLTSANFNLKQLVGSLGMNCVHICVGYHLLDKSEKVSDGQA